MAETRVRTYQWADEQRRDEADALAQGWRVRRRETWENDTLRVTYERGDTRFHVGAREVAVGVLAVLTFLVFLSSQSG